MKIKEITEGVPVVGRFLIIENQLKVTKNGSNYLAMRIGDPTGELAVKVWNADEVLFRLLEVGRVMEIRNTPPKCYKEQIQLELDGKNPGGFQVVSDSEVDFSQFLPTTPNDIGNLWQYLSQTMAAIKNVHLCKVLEFFFGRPEFVTHFMKVPAALKRHHAYLGGLLEHTAGVTAMCEAAAQYYPHIDQDLLITGAILHDIGKTRTYKLEKGFDGTDEGKFIGHLVIGIEMVSHAIEATFGTMDAAKTLLKNNLLHLLVSHHGIMEWGSPVEPLTIEACILHHADNMDAQVTKFLTIIRGDQSAGWSAYDPGLGRSIYINRPSYNAEEDLSEGA